jgi:hypothetical protein
MGVIVAAAPATIRAAPLAARRVAYECPDDGRAGRLPGEQTDGRGCRPVWFGFTEDADAIASCRGRLRHFDDTRPPDQAAFRHWVKSPGTGRR